MKYLRIIMFLCFINGLYAEGLDLNMFSDIFDEDVHVGINYGVYKQYNWPKGKMDQKYMKGAVYYGTGKGLGINIYSIFPGEIENIYLDEEYGNTIVISHDYGLKTLYRCVENVKYQTNVDSGDVIAQLGTSHGGYIDTLYFDLRIDNESYNPELFRLLIKNEIVKTKEELVYELDKDKKLQEYIYSNTIFDEYKIDVIINDNIVYEDESFKFDFEEIEITDKDKYGRSIILKEEDVFIVDENKELQEMIIYSSNSYINNSFSIGDDVFKVVEQLGYTDNWGYEINENENINELMYYRRYNLLYAYCAGSTRFVPLLNFS